MDIKSMYLAGKSIPEIATETGAPRSTIRCRLLALDVVLRTRKQGVLLAAERGRLGGGGRGKTRVFSDEWRARISASKIIAGERYAKGVSVKPSGYVEYTRGEHKGRRVHAVVIEKIIGRRLFANECVHHKNHDRADNRPENLQLMTKAGHASHHAKENAANLKRDQKGRFK